MIGVVLAGGESRRFPYNKCLLRLGGTYVIERILAVYKNVFPRVMVSTNQPEVYFKFGLNMVGDVLAERGPMTGILSSLMNTNTDWIFVSACDMPFISEKLIRYMISLNKQADAVIPVFGGDPQPLFGMYHRRLIAQMYGNITQGRKSLRKFLNEINTFFILEEIVTKIDTEGMTFMNINTVDDLKRIEKRIDRSQGSGKVGRM